VKYLVKTFGVLSVIAGVCLKGITYLSSKIRDAINPSILRKTCTWTSHRVHANNHVCHKLPESGWHLNIFVVSRLRLHVPIHADLPCAIQPGAVCLDVPIDTGQWTTRSRFLSLTNSSSRVREESYKTPRIKRQPPKYRIHHSN
jgi:hypothetical protein